MSDSVFPEIEFAGQLRPSQQEVFEIAKKQLSQGQRRLHVVAPPGSGKTVLGLYLWAELVRKPCLVLSPNSAIQSQWASRVDLFKIEGNLGSFVSTDPRKPELLTSLTYQSVTLPSRGLPEIDRSGLELWRNKLIDESQVSNLEEANWWIEDLREKNPGYYQKQISGFKKKVRDEVARGGDSVSLLHQSSRETLSRLAELDVGLIILDECHHLLGHWGRVLADAMTMLGDPIVLGLTATPPDRSGKDDRDVERYDQFFGPIDFDVPVPAVVKDGYLAPYQDLAYFVRPNNSELQFIATADNQLSELIEEVCDLGFLKSRLNCLPEDSPPCPVDPPSNLPEWVSKTLSELTLPVGTATSWANFERRDPLFSLAARQFLISRGIELPPDVPELGVEELPSAVPPLEYWVSVLDRFIRYFLRRSGQPELQKVGEQLTRSLRTLGFQVTETGTRPCVSPVGRVLAYSKSKSDALVPILQQEMDNLDQQLRAVVIADFERSSAVTSELKDLMDCETGGAIAAFKSVLSDPKTDLLDPILLTGTTILIDDEIEEEFLKDCRAWLAKRNLTVSLSSEEMSGFRQISGAGSDWAPRVYVEMITGLFQKGLTRCLVGTRGLLGEGWDANKINVLIDLTTVTTKMSINQLRGRSFRLDPAWQDKLANNWDVVCLAPEFNKGFDDYRRFKDKHKHLYGVSDDGVIEMGVGHVHPAFTDVKPEGILGAASVLNSEMLSRSQGRDHVRGLWKIGDPFLAKPINAVEIKTSNKRFGFPVGIEKKQIWTEESLTSAMAEAVMLSFVELGHFRSGLRYRLGQLSGGYVRVFLEEANPTEGSQFSEAIKELLGPIDRPRYLIPRQVKRRYETWLSSLLPELLGHYFEKTKNEIAMYHAVPTALAKNKSDVTVFQKYWNRLVSPGEAVYAYRGEGEELVHRARKSNGEIIVHEKRLFL
ncbi:MAG: DEAD/DEAH box helicase family protein [Planctomycetaceae bacterium]|nr:DEAD/DEAH box helicase family protein [Planctomycetaceae bacterium]